MIEETKKNALAQFKMVLNPKYIISICDENEKVVAFGLIFPGIGSALQKTGGRLKVPTIIKLLKSINKPKTFNYQNIMVWVLML